MYKKLIRLEDEQAARVLLPDGNWVEVFDDGNVTLTLAGEGQPAGLVSLYGMVDEFRSGK